MMILDYINYLVKMQIPNNSQTEFDAKFKEMGFDDKKHILDFLTDYKQFTYTKENINKYIELLVFFKYKILNEFLEYILQFQLLEVISNIYALTVITDIYNNTKFKWKSDEQLIYVSKYINITILNLYDTKITDNGIKHLTQIRELYCNGKYN